MKFNRIFIASSAEMKQERMELVDLLQDLNDEVENQGLKFKPVLWEYMDSSMGEKRKEDEYLEELRQCDICLVLFWRTQGEYTLEELVFAEAEKAAASNLKHVYVLFKEPADGISEELSQIKKETPKRYPDLPVFTFDSPGRLRDIVSNLLGAIVRSNLKQLQ